VVYGGGLIILYNAGGGADGDYRARISSRTANKKTKMEKKLGPVHGTRRAAVGTVE